MFKILLCLCLSTLSFSHLFSDVEENKKNDSQSHKWFYSMDFDFDWSYLSNQPKLKSLIVSHANNTNLPSLLINAAKSSSLEKIDLDFFLFSTVYENIDELNFSNPPKTFPVFIKNLILDLGHDKDLKQLDIVVMLSKATPEVKADFKQLEDDYKKLHPKTKTTIKALTNNSSPGGG